MRGIFVSFLAVCACLHQPPVFASEIGFTLEEKVQRSGVVAVGKVTKVALGKIRDMPGSASPRIQDTFIHFEIEQRLLGLVETNIILEAHSTSFEEGTSSHASTAGFNNYGIEPGQRFIAYLRRKDDGYVLIAYVLSGESNQFFGSIDDQSNMVRDIGQTGKMIPLDEKLKVLGELIRDKIQSQRESRKERTDPAKQAIP